VGPSGVVMGNLFSGDTRGMLLGLEAMTMHALLLQRSEHAVGHSVLLRAVRRDEPLSKAIAAHHPRVRPQGEDQPVIRPQK
jgi:hypothetical protein